ncbi:MAG: hypothetical protein HY596_01530 [Candidatus Omnitrophica bacterium]|nr:hypothetical protein [Candidatus Omnitrophota bacterium]
MSQKDTIQLEHSFSYGRPIRRRAEDKLGRSGFAEAIAQAIQGWGGDDSLVVALHGPWGSGKSSIKNMVIDTLWETPENRRPNVVEFNPWQFAGHDQISEAFFKEVGIALGKQDQSEIGRRLAAQWKLYAANLRLSATLAETVRSLGPVIMFVGFVGLGLTCLADSVIRPLTAVVSLAVGILGVALRWGAGFAEKLSDVFRARAEAYQKSLGEIKEELSELLRQGKRPLLVVMDDIDRLDAHEIRLLFQVVKANADLPRLIYLLLFQRDIVEKSLRRLAPISGRDFLRKIVQVEFDIPVVERPRLERVLLGRLDELLSGEEVGKNFDSRRWGNIYIPGLRPYFQSLRDVYRFLSTLEFHVGLFRTKNENTRAFEVNPIDLIALEVLRVFEPDIYQRLPGVKEMLTDLSSDKSGKEREEIRRTIESIVARAPQELQEQVREILKQLFPKIEWVFGGYGYGSGFDERWFREARVCHPNVFDRYFHFVIPEGDISKADIDRLLSLVGDRQGLVSEFRALNKRNLLGVALDRFEAYKQEIGLEHAGPFVSALLDIGDELPEGDIFFGPEANATRIIHWYLKQEKDQKRRGQLLLRAMKETTGLYLAVRKTANEDDGPHLQKQPDDFLVDEADSQELRKVSIEKIRKAANSGVLATHPRMAFILYRWREWASKEEPTGWVTNLVESKQGLLSFLAAFLQRSTSQSIGDYVARVNWRIKLKDLEDFISLDVLEKKVEQLTTETPAKNLGEREQRAVETFQKALKRRREGKPDDDWPTREDED